MADRFQVLLGPDHVHWISRDLQSAIEFIVAAIGAPNSQLTEETQRVCCDSPLFCILSMGSVMSFFHSVEEPGFLLFCQPSQFS